MKRKNVTYIPPNKIIFLRDSYSNFTIKDSLFGSVKSAKNTDPGKYVYSGYGWKWYKLL